MLDSEIADRGLVLLGCGKMGSALLEGWINRGLPARSVHVIDPQPTDWLRASGVGLNGDLPPSPAIALLAVKPQIMETALPRLAGLGGGKTLFLSVAAGVTLARFETTLGPATPIIRSIPNTPAAVGQGITAIVGNAATGDDHIRMAEELLSAVGQVVRLDHEDQMDAVTGVSGSGPAYVFHMIECIAAAAEAEGLSPELALSLARATVAGSGALAMQSDEDPAQLRRNVTSPNGTTQAGLEILMEPENGLPKLMRATVAAAAARSRELGRA